MCCFDLFRVGFLYMTTQQACCCEVYLSYSTFDGTVKYLFRIEVFAKYVFWDQFFPD